MRIKIKLKSEDVVIIPNNQKYVNSFIHKCLGSDNEYHDKPSDYCLSSLNGGYIIDNGKNVKFENGAFIVFTTPRSEILNKLIIGLNKNNGFGHGLFFYDIEFISEKIYDGYNFFKTMDNGFIIKDKENGFLTLNDDDFILKLENHVKNKLMKINNKLNFNGFKIEINNHPNHKTKNVYVKNVKNISNVCQLKIFSNRKVAETLYNYGIGQSTGSGFGTIYKTENVNVYK